MPSEVEIIIGTYEEFLLGYTLDIKSGSHTLTQSFADKSHSGSIKCLAVNERWVASAGTDDRIFIYDMSTRRQSQILINHEGTINTLVFTPDGTHLISGGEDGRMIATQLKTWFVDATWTKAHNGSPVTHISCHPSGKLALSLGSDHILRTWNLVKGRVAYKTNLKSRSTLGLQPDCLSWSPNGDYFTLSGPRVLEFWSIKTADVQRTHKTKSKPVCLTWISNNTCLVGLEDGKILWLSIDNEQEKEIDAHSKRVKSMNVFKQILVSASSSGELKVWQINEDQQNLNEIAATNIGCRPTCLGILDLQQFQTNITSSTLKLNEKDTKSNSLKTKRPIPQRGVVTIEYENADDDTDQKAESEEDDESGNNEVDNHNFAAVDSDDDDTSNEDESDDDDISEDESDNQNAEPEMMLSKSRKHKLPAVRNTKQKKQKIGNGSKKEIKKKQKQKVSVKK